MLDLTIIILNYNTKDFLKAAVLSLQKNISKKITKEIIVVDNASADGSKEMMKKEFPQITLVASGRNLGFSGGNNLGVKKAKKSRYVLFLNPDTEVGVGVVEHMVMFMDDHKDAGASTCKLVMANGNIDDASHRGFPTPWNSFSHFSGLSKIFGKTKLFGGYNLGYKDFKTTHEIDVLAGAFILVRYTAGEQVGWWDEDYFFYGEDIEFCYDLKEKGWKIYYVPEVEIFHHKGVTAGIRKESETISTADKERKIFATKHRFNAMKIFYNKHYKNKYSKVVTNLVMQGINYKEKKTLKKLQ